MRYCIALILFTLNSINCKNFAEKSLKQVLVENTYQHFIMYGQSLSVGAQSYPVLSTENIDGNYMLGDHIWINFWNNSKSKLNPLIGKLAKQDSSGAADLYPFTKDGSTTAECPLYGTVNHLQKKIGGNFIATSCGTGGRSIEELSKESKISGRQHYRAEFVNALTNGAKATKNAGCDINCPVIFFMQGENNYGKIGYGLGSGTTATSDKDEYKQLLVTLKDNMQNDITEAYGQNKKPVFITYQAGCQYTKVRELSIGMAQLEASNEYADIICAGPVYPMPDRGGHLDPNGYRWFGEMLAKIYYKTQVLGEEFKPLQPKKITRTNNPYQIKIQYHVPVLPLVLDPYTSGTKFKYYGFEVYKNDIKQIIQKVEVVDDDCIMIACFSDVSSGKIELIYAGIGENTSQTRGHGNVRDSDNYQAYFEYVDLDKKENEDYVYPRDPGSSLRAVNEAKDSSGQAIYDQTYPLYNWSVAFYYKLEDGQPDYIVPGFFETDYSNSHVAANNDLEVFVLGKKIFISTKNTCNANIVIDIFDIAGHFLFHSVMSESDKYISLDSLNKGIYVAKVYVNGISKQIKILI